MKKLVKGLSFLVVLGSILVSFSKENNADFEKDYKMIVTEYAKHSKSRIEMKYELFSDFTGNKLVMSQTGLVERDKLNYFSRAFDKEMLQTPDCMVNIDKKHKIIFINEIPVKYVLNKENGIMTGKMEDIFKAIDSLSNRLKEVKLLGINGDIKTYNIPLPESRFKAIDMGFDIKNHCIKKIVIYPKSLSPDLHYKGNTIPRVEITYVVTNFNPEFKNDEFSINKYVKKINNEYIVSNLYKGYKVIHNKFTTK